jgi:hypothetical protein
MFPTPHTPILQDNVSEIVNLTFIFEMVAFEPFPNGAWWAANSLPVLTN